MISIRQADFYDLPQLAILFDSYRIFYEKESNLAQALEFLSERIKNEQSVIYVAENQVNGLVGFVQLYPIFSSLQMKRLWLLNDLFVKPDFRGQHISVMLIDHAKQLARESNSCGLMLETAKNNEIGNQLYPSTNFQLDTEFNYYYWSI